MENNWAVLFGNIKLVHEKLDDVRSGLVDKAFFCINKRFKITANNFGLRGFFGEAVVDDAVGNDVDPHVGWRIIDIFAGNAMENFFDDWEDF